VVQFFNLPNTKAEVERLRKNSSYYYSKPTSNFAEGPNVLGLVQWSVFPKPIQDMDPNTRIKFSKERIPVGSKFTVYVNGIENGFNMILTLSFYSAPILNLKKVEMAKSDSKSKFRYLIIMDLEATCDFSPSPVVDNTTAEIIEFPWVVLDTATLEFKDQKQLYIRPDNLDGMSPYCRVLTGITAENVSTGCSLAEAIHMFDSFVQTLPQDSFRILTDGVWDLQVQLRAEAHRKQIPLAKWFQEYFNLKEEFRKFLPWFPFRQREPSLHIMLRALNLDFVGKHHSGFDDCFSIAQIVQIMIQRGHKFDNPITIPTEYNISSDPSFVTFSSYAPPGSWVCEVCREKFSGPVWNKPTALECRFCSTPHQENYSTTPSDVQYT
jgi:inhibitor of KinA sporulation pathway (predicted exonuclease)